MLGNWPVLVGLKRRFRPRASPRNGEYSRFTTIYDEIVHASDLPKYLPPVAPAAAQSYADAMMLFDAGFQAERIAIAEWTSQLVRDLCSGLTGERRARTVVSFLVDHSGSMRGLRMLSAVIAVQGALQALRQSDIAAEVLGFTTVNWKGGRSRRAWRWAGRPKSPGRLCDLRHIIYAEAGSYITAPWNFRYALRPDLLHENVDGEALEWAAGRLDTGHWDHRLICLVSDGVPVDDSTLLSNDGNFLNRHLEATQRDLKERGTMVATLLLGSEHVFKPDLFEQAAEPRSAGIGLLNLIRRGLLGADAVGD